MQTITIALWLTLLSLLLGCQTAQGPIDRDNSNHIPPVGSIIELHQAIPVYPGFSRSFIQFGKTMRSKEVKQRYPWCQFRLYEPPSALQTERNIQPDKFLVTQSRQQYAMLAAISVLPNIRGHDGPSDQDLSSIMRVSSPIQPQVIEFKCSIFAEPQNSSYLTINEMQETLGALVSIQLP